jgi:cystathionine beta-lyase/cystathionine gamma-synthase
MAESRYRRDRIGDHRLHPETLMLGYGYDPALSEGAVKQPVFLTSTFVFRTAEEGRDFFDFTSGRREPGPSAAAGLVYSRFNHPNSEIVEDRLAVYEAAETAAIFSSGMSAIATTLLAYARPGDVILHSQPLYGGTETLVSRTLEPLGIGAVGFMDGVDPRAVTAAAEGAVAKGRVSVAGHPSVAKVHYPGFLPEDSAEGRVFKAQCEAAGTTFSFDLAGGQAEAFRLLNALQVFKLAVSLGGTESLVCHPATTVHSGVPKPTRERLGITDATIRLSIGIEHAADLVADLTQALGASCK